MSENQTSKSLENIVDFKGVHLESYALAIDFFKEGEAIKVTDNTKIILLTHSAQIIGDYVFSDSDDEKNDDLTVLLMKQTAAAVREITNEYISKIETEENEVTFSNLAKAIHLKNVKVIPFANHQVTLNYPYLIVYSDQVVGVTMASDL